MGNRWTARLRFGAVLAIVITLGACTGSDALQPSEGSSISQIAQGMPTSFEDMAARLAEIGFVLRPMPKDVQVLPLARFEVRLHSTFGGDFRIVSIQRGLVSNSNPLVVWANEPVPMYAAEIIGRGSGCFYFFDAGTGKQKAGAC